MGCACTYTVLMKVNSTEEREGDAGRSIGEFERLSGKGASRGWRFNRDAIHSRQDTVSGNPLPERRPEGY
jgi:hypothetical protein